jgi:hypothetical protein
MGIVEERQMLFGRVFPPIQSRITIPGHLLPFLYKLAASRARLTVDLERDRRDHLPSDFFKFSSTDGVRNDLVGVGGELAFLLMMGVSIDAMADDHARSSHRDDGHDGIIPGFGSIDVKSSEAKTRRADPKRFDMRVACSKKNTEHCPNAYVYMVREYSRDETEFTYIFMGAYPTEKVFATHFLIPGSQDGKRPPSYAVPASLLVGGSRHPVEQSTLDTITAPRFDVEYDFEKVPPWFKRLIDASASASCEPRSSSTTTAVAVKVDSILAKIIGRGTKDALVDATLPKKRERNEKEAEDVQAYLEIPKAKPVPTAILSLLKRPRGDGVKGMKL